jgi:hypothetical protein
MPEKDLLGARIGHIRLVDFVAHGGMGSVYVGFDETLERKVAVKAIHDARRLNAETQARFKREARVLSSLAHPGICRRHPPRGRDRPGLGRAEGRCASLDAPRGSGHTHGLPMARRRLVIVGACEDGDRSEGVLK